MTPCRLSRRRAFCPVLANNVRSVNCPNEAGVFFRNGTLLKIIYRYLAAHSECEVIVWIRCQGDGYEYVDVLVKLASRYTVLYR